MELDEAQINLLYKQADRFASKYYKIGQIYDREDLVQIAMIAALSAAKRYDASQESLITFLYKRMKGAILDEIREYTKTRQKGNIFLDHKVVRFSQLRNTVLESGEHGSIAEIIPSKEKEPGYRLEIKDSLNNWRKRNNITKKEWLVLKLRIGKNLLQSDVGKIFGLHVRKSSCPKICELEKKIFQKFSIGMNSTIRIPKYEKVRV